MVYGHALRAPTDGLGIGEQGLSLLDRGARRENRDLVGVWVDLEQALMGANRAIVVDEHVRHRACDLCGDRHDVRAHVGIIRAHIILQAAPIHVGAVEEQDGDEGEQGFLPEQGAGYL